jgi:hypothetical protein
VDHYQVAYQYDDLHTFGGSTCTGVEMSGHPVGGCRDVSGTSRNHTPNTSEQGGVTIWVRAFDEAGNISGWSSAVHYYYDATPPDVIQATPPGGDYTDPQSVELTSTDSGSGLAHIYYTTDGSDPNSSSTLYAGPISVAVDTTIKAIAYDNAGNASSISEDVYGIAPVIDGEQATLATTSSITITWTTDQPATSRVIYDTVPHANPLGSSTVNGYEAYGYQFTTGETDTSPKVTEHTVTVTGLTSGTLYYFRTVSHGSPESVSDQISGNTKKPSSGGGTSPSSTSTQSGNGGGGTGGQAGTTTGNANGGRFFAQAPTGTNNNDNNDGDNGDVKSAAAGVSGDSTTNNSENNSAASSMNWWWLLLLLLIPAYYFWRKRKHGQKDA